MRAQPGHLADFNFVELSRRGKYSVLTLLPYVGPMWYHRCSVEHMLHYGIASWDDVKWQLSASGRLPHDILVEPLLEIERAWGSDTHLAKYSINSMIGLWASTRTHQYSVITSSNPNDCPKSALTRNFQYADKCVIDHIQVTSLLDNASMRPIHDMVMGIEHTRMAQMYYIVKRLGCLCRSVKSVKTDALILEISRKKASTVQAAICDIRFDQLHELRRKYELGSDPDQRFLNSHAEVSPIASNDQVFRFSEIGNTLMGNYSKPCRSVSHLSLIHI